VILTVVSLALSLSRQRDRKRDGLSLDKSR
jgi:hypothetical protein